MQLPALLICSVIILAVVSVIYNKNALKHVSYSRNFSRNTVFEGEQIEMVERIVNNKLLPLPWLRLESIMTRSLLFAREQNLGISRGDIFQNHVSMFSMRSYRQIVRRHQVTCTQRGYYKLNSATLTTGDPLGRSSVMRQIPLSLELVVYPRIIALEELPLPNHSWLGDLAVRRWIVEDPFLTSGVRGYRSGDSLRSINWKATARTGDLQVHKRDYTADHRLVICLNIATSEEMWRTVQDAVRIEQGIRYAATVAHYALERGIPTGFICNGWVADLKKGPVRLEQMGMSSGLDDLLGIMAKLELEITVSMSALLDQEALTNVSNNDYLIISCYKGEALQQSVQALSEQGNGIEWMMIPDMEEENS